MTAAFALAQQTADVWVDSPPPWVQPDRAEAWRELVAQHGQQRARWNAATGTPTEVFGKGIQVPPWVTGDVESVRRAALELLGAQAALIGHPEDTWVPQIERRMGPLFVFVFEQQRDGLPVLGGRADVRIHVAGRVSMFGAASFEVAPGGPKPGIRAADALVMACAALDVRSLSPTILELQPPPSRLVYRGDPHADRAAPARLCWEVTLDAVGDDLVGRAYVDARSGQLVAFESDLSYCSGGHTHVRGFHPGLDRGAAAVARRLALAEAEAAVAEAVPGPTAVDAALPLTPVTGTVRAVIPVGTQPGDLSSPTTRAATLQLVPIPGVRVTIVATGEFDYTDGAGAFSITHAGTAPVAVQARFANGERYRAILPQSDPQIPPQIPPAAGISIVASGTATPGTPIVLDFGAIATITEGDLAQTTAAFYFDSVHRFLEGVLGALPPRTLNLVGAVNSPQICNAFYSAQSDAITFFSSPSSQGLGNQICNNAINTAYSNIIQHEYGHFLDDLFGGESFFEGMSEGWGDVVAMYHTGTDLVNERFYRLTSTMTHEWARSGLNTQQRGSWGAGGASGCDYPGASSIEVHCQGESWMGFAWKVRSNFLASVGSGFPNEFGSADQAVAAANAIVLGSIVSNAVDQNGAALQVYLLDDDDGDLLNRSPHSMWIDMAANAHNIAIPVDNNEVPTFLVYAVGCSQTQDVEIRVADKPRIGRMLVVDGSNAPPFARASLLLGFSDASFQGARLPLDLAPLGAPGCRLHVGADLLVPGATDAQGVCRAGLLVPFDQYLVGGLFFCQWLVADPGANAAGLVVGQAARGVWSR
ncbi:MAG: hypothetical protein AB7O97_07840 [Planctomycetota bacterium]